MRIDVHNHFIPPAFVDLVRSQGEHFATRIVRDDDGREWFLIKESARRPLNARVTTLEARLPEMDADRIDLQVLSCLPFMMYYDVDAAAGLDVAQIINDGLAAIARQQPARFAAFATVPLQEPEMAVEELERAVKELGLRGVQILTNVRGQSLDDPEFRQFWAKAQELDVPVMLHPFEARPTGVMAKNFLGNLLGNPFDTAIAASLLIISGVLRDFPRLKIILCHGGGAIPYIIGRVDRGWHAHGQGGVTSVAPELSEPPSRYLERCYFDTITFSQPALRYLVETVGASQVVIGTDYPLGMDLKRPVDFVETTEGLDDRAREAICGQNAAKLLKLEA